MFRVESSWTPSRVQYMMVWNSVDPAITQTVIVNKREFSRIARYQLPSISTELLINPSQSLKDDAVYWATSLDRFLVWFAVHTFVLDCGLLGSHHLSSFERRWSQGSQEAYFSKVENYSGSECKCLIIDNATSHRDVQIESVAKIGKHLWSGSFFRGIYAIGQIDDTRWRNQCLCGSCEIFHGFPELLETTQ